MTDDRSGTAGGAPSPTAHGDPASRADLRSLRPLAALDRRGFVAAALAGGFAAAVQPVAAQAISTDSVGLDAGEVRIPVGDGEMPAYRAMREGGRRLPVILVINEIFGVHEHIKDVCRRFAKLGYLAVAPELFARQGNPAAVTDIQVLMRDIVAKAPDAQVLRDLDATLAWARVNGGDRRRIGITGFCWGGRITWLYAAHSRDVKAGVAWYGRFVGEPNPLQPRNPVDVAAGLKAPVLGLYGGRDAGIPLDTVARMRAALQAPGASPAARASEIVVYPDAQHGFHADYRATYGATDAADAFGRARAWFATHGVAAG
jgi:carboxymethylenebutenolidase